MRTPSSNQERANFLDVADALMPVLHTGLDQIFDQVCGHPERVIEIGDRIHVGLGQCLS